jgi:3-methyl-2-oxobutanoate hydroxymethyltransferase
MSPSDRIDLDTLQQMKERGEKICALTAYDYPMARILDEVGVDIILVGDSLANVVLGYETTLPATMEDMVRHTAAVARGVKRALVVSDMPFLSFQPSAEEAVRNAGILLQNGARAVKLEGAKNYAGTIERIVSAGIPVMGHLGYTPQSVHRFGSRVVRGRTQAEANRLLADAKALQEAGCFGIVLECVPLPLAEEITQSLEIPTIGIGAGPHCDGQVLVLHDILGLVFGPRLKHTKVFSDVKEQISQAVKSYLAEVKEGTFPSLKHSFDN